ncbi:Mu transposase domain-containing protein [Kribbella qitaiheensis]|uniref:Mu transposase domain-containing protein n=1 Tax=Kribbella qitaiheensis TaxID=1544730 RepID=UPI0024835F58|nr:hypothetical protein [Kribbella qitaiheensis]
MFAVEQSLLAPLPFERFETGRWFTQQVDRYTQITVSTNHHSVPSRLIGRQVQVLLNASDLLVFDGRTEVARHERLIPAHRARHRSGDGRLPGQVRPSRPSWPTNWSRPPTTRS